MDQFMDDLELIANNAAEYNPHDARGRYAVVAVVWMWCGCGVAVVWLCCGCVVAVVWLWCGCGVVCGI